MYQSLIYEKKIKTDELAKKEAEYSLLEQEIENLQDEEYQVKYIEDRLAVQYAEMHDRYPVDKKQEPEIEDTISEKRTEIERIIEVNKKQKKEALREWLDADRNYTPYVSQTYVSPIEDNYEKKRKKAEEKYKRDLERARSRHSAYTCKEFEQSEKSSDKECIYELKRIFGEVEVDLKRYQKKGISRYYLSKMVDILDNICSTAADYGKMPVSYQQKVYKWRQIEDELPIDEEIEIQREQEEKDKLAKEIKSINRKITSHRNIISKLSNDKSEIDNDLVEYHNELEQLIQDNPKKKEQIIANAQSEKEKLQNSFSEKENEIKVKFHNQSMRLKDLQARLEQLNRESDSKSAEYNNTGIFAFSRRRVISNRIEEIRSETSRINNILLSIKNTSFGSIDAEMEYELSELQQEFETKYRKLDDSTSHRIKDVDEEITEKKKLITKAEEELEIINESIKKENVVLEKMTEEKNSINAQLKDFHNYYLINHYGKDMQLPQTISDKKKELKSISAEIKSLKKEINNIDKALVKAEKEQSKMAKEAEKALKEKEKRQKRIQKELIDRQEELTVIEANPITLTSIPPIIKAIEAAKEHSYLKADKVPLADDGKRLITNNIVRKTYTQKKLVENCSQYVLMFVDHLGNPISEQRLIPQNEIGEKTSTSFELKSDEGFDDHNYYLMMFNFDTGDIICATKYQINIAFANDFDF